MAGTPADNFRVAFLKKCASDGLTLPQIHQRVKQAVAAAMVKTANPVMLAGAAAGAANAGATGVVHLADRAASLFGDYMKSPAYLMAAGIPLAAAVGGTAGHTLGKLQSEDYDPEELKQQELTQAYKAHAKRIKQMAAVGG